MWSNNNIYTARQSVKFAELVKAVLSLLSLHTGLYVGGIDRGVNVLAPFIMGRHPNM